MTAPPEMDEAFWRDFLEQGGDTWMGVGRSIFRRIPADPRCRMCASPFQGPGAWLMRLIGKRQSDANPNWCNSCFDFMAKHHGGAEIEGAMLFADIRGSTSLAERMSHSLPREPSCASRGTRTRLAHGSRSAPACTLG